jgi:hypothetical protein
MWVAKCNIDIMTLNPHYLWEAKILNPHIKHGTFLVEFDDRIKIIFMYVCMASYMMASYGHANHAFRVNVCS